MRKDTSRVVWLLISCYQGIVADGLVFVVLRCISRLKRTKKWGTACTVVDLLLRAVA